MHARLASLDDVPLLAELNRQLIEDERAANAMSLAELEARMRAWLEGEYRAALFDVTGETVAYALFRPSDDGIYLRQFFVTRSQRRKGHGRCAIRLLREQLLSPGQTLELDVPCTTMADWRFGAPSAFASTPSHFAFGRKSGLEGAHPGTAPRCDSARLRWHAD